MTRCSRSKTSFRLPLAGTQVFVTVCFGHTFQCLDHERNRQRVMQLLAWLMTGHAKPPFLISVNEIGCQSPVNR